MEQIDQHEFKFGFRKTILAIKILVQVRLMVWVRIYLRVVQYLILLSEIISEHNTPIGDLFVVGFLFLYDNLQSHRGIIALIK